MKSKVSVVRCADYSQCEEAVCRALDLTGTLGDFRGKRVILKVNLMKGAAPERALNTHPELVRAVARIVRDQGGEPVVGESSGILGLTREVCRAAGLMDALEQDEIEFLDFDSCKIVEKRIDGEVLDRIWVAEEIANGDSMLVTLPKLKTHTITLMTGALKNQVGLLPGGSKCLIHERGPSPESVARAIVDINRALPPALAVVDGILGLGGQGKGVGSIPTELGVIVAGRDAVAVDSACARLIGFDPMEVDTTRIAAERGLGKADPAEIELVGDSLDECKKEFERPGFELKRWRPVARHFYHMRGRSVMPWVDTSKCTKCGTCAEICPTAAVNLSPWPVIGPECVRCYSCHYNCPEDAIELRCRWYLRRSFRRRAEGVNMEKLS